MKKASKIINSSYNDFEKRPFSFCEKSNVCLSICSKKYSFEIPQNWKSWYLYEKRNFHCAVGWWVIRQAHMEIHESPKSLFLCLRMATRRSYHRLFKWGRKILIQGKTYSDWENILVLCGPYLKFPLNCPLSNTEHLIEISN